MQAEGGGEAGTGNHTGTGADILSESKTDFPYNYIRLIDCRRLFCYDHFNKKNFHRPPSILRKSNIINSFEKLSKNTICSEIHTTKL